MNRIEKLIEEMCAEGVPVFPVSKFAKIQGGFSFPSSGMNSDGNGLQVIRIGDVNEKGSNKVFFLGEYPENSLVEKGNLLLSLSGDIGVKHWEGNTALLNQRVARIDLNLSLVVPRYVYHFFGFAIPKLTSKVRKSAVANLSMNSLRSFEIPLPPLEVQIEIVNILDKFTQLEAELEAELEAREKQYEEVRRKLLDFQSDTSNHPLGEMIREMCPEGLHTDQIGNLFGYEQPTKYLVSNTNYAADGTPVLTAGQTFTLGHTDETEGIFRADNQYPIILFDDFTTSFKWVDFPFKVKSSAAKIIKPLQGNRDSLRFLFHWMGAIGYEPGEHSRQWISKYSKITMPVPPLEIQKEIVRILDNLDSLVNSVNEGIPAEIAARGKQYEFYRDKLLTFKELDAA